jgi:hypothetical protein
MYLSRGFIRNADNGMSHDKATIYSQVDKERTGYQGEDRSMNDGKAYVAIDQRKLISDLFLSHKDGGSPERTIDWGKISPS